MYQFVLALLFVIKVHKISINYAPQLILSLAFINTTSGSYNSRNISIQFSYSKSSTDKGDKILFSHSICGSTILEQLCILVFFRVKTYCHMF